MNLRINRVLSDVPSERHHLENMLVPEKAWIKIEKNRVDKVKGLSWCFCFFVFPGCSICSLIA